MEMDSSCFIGEGDLLEERELVDIRTIKESKGDFVGRISMAKRSQKRAKKPCRTRNPQNSVPGTQKYPPPNPNIPAMAFPW